MLTSLSKFITTVVSDELLQHLDFAIQVAVSHCLCEIVLCITTPDTSYFHHLHILLTHPPAYILTELGYLKLWLM